MTEILGVFSDASTGEVIERNLDETELKELAIIQKASSQLEKEAKAKAEARKSALTKLAALGLTEAEIASI
jgi:predicted transposase YdaD